MGVRTDGCLLVAEIPLPNPVGNGLVVSLTVRFRKAAALPSSDHAGELSPAGSATIDGN